MSLDFTSAPPLPGLARVVFLGDFPGDAEAWQALQAVAARQPPCATLGLIHRGGGDLGGEETIRQWLKQGFQLIIFATEEHDEFSGVHFSNTFTKAMRKNN